MEHVSPLVNRVLTETQAPLTPTSTTPITAKQSYDWQFQTLGDPELEKMLTAVRTFARSIVRREQPHWLTLAGTSGAGKTHLAKRLLQWWREHGGWAVAKGRGGDFKRLLCSRFVSWRKFIKRQRNGEHYEHIGIRETVFVVIDDIGAERDPTGFAKDQLDDVCDARLGRWTVFTTNLNLPQISEALDTRIASRLLRGGSKFVYASVPDFNLRTLK